MFYIVGTPIGNMQDASMRMVKALVHVDIILVEDAQSFDSFYKNIQELFNLHPQKSQKIIHFHKENEFELLPQVLNLLQEDKNIALVSESGMPTVCDPGSLLLTCAVKENISYTVIPGPTAFVNACVLSGFSTKNLLFLGFLPKKQFQLLQLINKLKSMGKMLIDLTVVFYESPHRINHTLTIIDEVLPNNEICICREMTKKFEEVIRGKAHELLNYTYKGELAVVIRAS
ncbi:MAG TPA: 16S rRNA (cytidine(1402)-2'-O)-methyltransferase [Patescibacteria group bacterium]|nr:16S rRNA (cytidine(1402)-2'-O)-methyltransferase [Patescibacteria group bacterium]